MVSKLSRFLVSKLIDYFLVSWLLVCCQVEMLFPWVFIASFEAFTAEMFQVEFFLVVKPCSVAVGYQCFGGPYCFHLQDEAA
jgi:hypothetical protein